MQSIVEPFSQKGVILLVADKNATRQELIIKTAMQLFAVKGSSSTSMQEIAELCGISKGSLYLVFKSKEELERSIYMHCFRMIHDPLQQEEQNSRSNPREKLRNQVEILLTHVHELRGFCNASFRRSPEEAGTRYRNGSVRPMRRSYSGSRTSSPSSTARQSSRIQVIYSCSRTA